jgi:regulator of protease activity HflC (stomatin/prohibitin superfamily)
MGFWRQISPRRAVSDFANEWRQPNPYRWRVLGVSVAATFALMMVLLPESQRIEPQPPEVTWITTFAEGRTDAEIEASNIENQKRKDRLKAEAEARAARAREAYKALGRATGVDVDAMEAEAERERAAEEAATAQQARAPVEQ